MESLENFGKIFMCFPEVFQDLIFLNKFFHMKPNDWNLKWERIYLEFATTGDTDMTKRFWKKTIKISNEISCSYFGICRKQVPVVIESWYWKSTKEEGKKEIWKNIWEGHKDLPVRRRLKKSRNIRKLMLFWYKMDIKYEVAS